MSDQGSKGRMNFFKATANTWLHCSSTHRLEALDTTMEVPVTKP